jgi:hypothetical protein
LPFIFASGSIQRFGGRRQHELEHLFSEISVFIRVYPWLLKSVGIGEIRVFRVLILGGLGVKRN